MRDDYDPLSDAVLGSAIRVHKRLGPGVLESTYEECLAWLLVLRGIAVRRQCILPLVFEGRRLNAAYRIDLIVDDRLIVEVKAIERILPLHEAQLRTYLKLSGIKVGLLLNFHPEALRDGIRRISM